jgi:rhodanese-related sulfurtransferase
MASPDETWSRAARQAVATIPNDQLHTKLAAGASVVLDVREREEWDAGHIPQDPPPWGRLRRPRRGTRPG